MHSSKHANVYRCSGVCSAVGRDEPGRPPGHVLGSYHVTLLREEEEGGGWGDLNGHPHDQHWEIREKNTDVAQYSGHRLNRINWKMENKFFGKKMWRIRGWNSLCSVFTGENNQLWSSVFCVAEINLIIYIILYNYMSYIQLSPVQQRAPWHLKWFNTHTHTTRSSWGHCGVFLRSWK